ncbi:MAG: protein kinase [Prosthecobacter sp.]|nr:protein kinase [Prosthecobacter sp.]
MRRFFSFTKRAPSAHVPSVSEGASGWKVPQVYPTPEELTQMMHGGLYVFDAMIGMGGMAAVYRGTQTNLGRPVAIKILNREHGADYDYSERFRREAQVLAQMSHPNIVSVYDFGLLGRDHLFYVMEYIEGTDLHHLMTLGTVGAPRALQIVPAVCDALDYAHGQGLVHRDIKPANILLAHDGRVKVADFGLAKRIDQTTGLLTRTNMAMGTPEYAAPEQYDAKAVLDSRADVYALGVVFYQMLTGSIPRGAWQAPSALMGTDPRLDAVVVRALNPDRDHRYASAADFKHGLLNAINQPPQSGAPEPETRGSAGRVLVLEDDALLRHLIVRTLKNEAFEVIETADGTDTVSCYKEALEQKKPFDVVLIDLTIPMGMGGAQAMELLIQLDPQVDAIVSSGNRGDANMLEPVAHGFAAALPKPYESPDLVRMVKQVLQRRRQRQV